MTKGKKERVREILSLIKFQSSIIVISTIFSLAIIDDRRLWDQVIHACICDYEHDNNKLDFCMQHLIILIHFSVN